MINNAQNVARLFRGHQRTFERVLDQTTRLDSLWTNLATEVSSLTETEDYTWMDEVADFREWLGDRYITNLSAFTYSITNRLFERTMQLPITKLEDDRLGVFYQDASGLALAARRWPNKLVIEEALAGGNAKICYDGQNFFSASHPVGSGVQSNYDSAGGGQPWYLIDDSRSLKPIVFQIRQRPRYFAMTDPNAHEAAFNRRYIYGADARGNAGYGIWQTAYRSHQPLTAANFKAARLAMRDFRNPDNKILGIEPTLLVVGRSNQDAADDLLRRKLVNDGTGGGDSVGVDNILAGAVRMVVVPQLP